MEDIVIVAAARTAVGKFGGTLAKTPAPDLGAAVIKASCSSAPGSSGEQIGEVILGQVLTAGAGQNPARQAVIKSGLPETVPALTINEVCGSGLKAVMLAAQAIARRRLRDRHRRRPGEHEPGAARAAGLARRPAHGRLEAGRLDDRRRPVGRLQPVPHGHHGRERGQEVRASAATKQDALALGSQQKAAAAQEAGSSRTRSCRSASPQKKGDPIVFADDEFINKKTSADALAGLRPAFDKAGTVTAGNASGLNDGAAARGRDDARKKAAAARPQAARAHRELRHRRARSVDHGHGPGAGVAKRCLQKAGWKRSRPRPDGDQRGVRRAGLRGQQGDGLGHQRRSTSTAARSRSATRSAPRAAASW